MAFEVIRIETIDDLKEHVRAITARVRKTGDAGKEPGVGPKSEMAKSLISVWEKSDFGCQAAHVAQILRVLVREVAHEDVEFRRTDRGDEDVVFDYPRFSAVVPLEHSGSHSYPVGEAFIVNGRDAGDGRSVGGVCSGCEIGNNHWGAWR